jgi:purine-binding chemotaxis protein CheW
MDDYFEDMFGHVTEDPLKKLEAQEQAAVGKLHKDKAEKKPSATHAKKPSPAHAKVKPKKHAEQLLVTDFADPDEAKGKISPLIIPAAFPKLAPVAQKVQVEPAAKPLLVTKDKLDKKTALAILLKQKSGLSQEQRLRLKEKLLQMEKKKQLAQKQQLAVEPRVSQNIEFKQAEPVKIMTEPVTAKEVVAPISAPATSDLTKEHAVPGQFKPYRPEWLDRRFECLLFSVAGLKLAVPLISLGAIYKIEKEFTPLVGRASWFMGLYHHLERNVRVVDTAQWVMPERHSEQVRSNYKFIIRLGNSDWGMACDAVHQSIQLYPDQVKWRSERTKRIWLYGTVIDHMCALIDADALNAILDQQAPINISH